MLDVYRYLLAEGCAHLQLYASLHPAGWSVLLFLSQDELDATLARTFLPDGGSLYSDPIFY